MHLIDISRSLTAAVAVWPGDAPFEHAWTARIDQGASVNLSTVRLSVHAGTHADAPLHVEAEGLPIEQIPLLHFIGPCHVVACEENTALTPDLVAFNDAQRISRILFKTRHSNVSDEKWDPDLAPLLPETIERLAAQGVVLIGTDAPSVDPVESKALKAHHALARNGIVNLENLFLKHVVPGAYQLIAFPLKVPGLDAAPVRAILVANGEMRSTAITSLPEPK